MKRLFQGALICAISIFAVPKSAVAASLPELWFPVGETLTYDMHCGVLHVGTTTVTTEWINENGKTRLAIRFVTRTNKFFDNIYRVEDVVESIVDPETFLPVRMHKKISEANFETDERTTFDFQSMTAHWECFTRHESHDYKLSPDSRDIVSFMFLMRKAPIDGGKMGSYWVAGDKGMCRLTLRGGRTDTVTLDAFGTISATRIVPDVTRDPLFVRKMPREVWVSTDPRRIIVKMIVNVPVATVTLTLDGVAGPGDDFWARKSQKQQDSVVAHD